LADLVAVVTDAAARAIDRRPGSSGRATRETCVAALRAVFARAVAAGIVLSNPAAALVKPRRHPSRRRALDERELAELIDAVRLTSRDPDLDLLLVRFHLETGARRDGALRLRRRDLDEVRSTLWLREKGGTEREQPVSPSLVDQLGEHEHRTAKMGGRPSEPGRTDRRTDHRSSSRRLGAWRRSRRWWVCGAQVDRWPSRPEFARVRPRRVAAASGFA
jgi:integrase